MTWNNDRVWVGRIGPPDGPHRGWPAYPLGNGPITGRLTIGYVSNVLQDLPLERGEDRPVNRHAKSRRWPRGIRPVRSGRPSRWGQPPRRQRRHRPVCRLISIGKRSASSHRLMPTTPSSDAATQMVPYRRVLQLAHRRHADLQIRDWESALIVYHIAPSRGNAESHGHVQRRFTAAHGQAEEGVAFSLDGRIDACPLVANDQGELLGNPEGGDDVDFRSSTFSSAHRWKSLPADRPLHPAHWHSMTRVRLIGPSAALAGLGCSGVAVIPAR